MRSPRNVQRVMETVYSFDDTAQEIFRVILREVLRLEVALCCPDLPMTLTDDVYLCMGSHLREVFGNKLKVVIFEIHQLKMENLYEDPETLNHLAGTLIMGIKEIWNKLDFQSCQV